MLYYITIPLDLAALRSGQLGVDKGSGQGVLREGIRVYWFCRVYSTPLQKCFDRLLD